nr:reverse transcriptase domain-containing protein [Tanacetum cinerariifolium]
MSEPVEQAPTPANSAVQDTAGKGSKQAIEDKPEYLLEDRLREICDKHYNRSCPSCERQREIKREWDATDDTSHRHSARTEETCLSENEYDQGGHWKSKSKKQMSTNEEDLSQPWLCEETDPFTARIRNFEVPKRTCMPTNVKTYDGTGDPEDHLKIFQTAVKIKRWSYAHMVPHVQLHINRLSQSLV